MIAHRKYRLSRGAIGDLIDIHNYIFLESGQQAAVRVTDGIEAKILAIANLGLTGVSCPELGPGLRSHPHKNYRIYFRVSASHIQIIRILHGRQNPLSEDFPESEN